MRRFRLKQGDFSKSDFHEYGETYEFKRIDPDGDIWLIERDNFEYCYLPDQLEEVFKPLHKDTDLGYYTGLAMQGFISDHSTGLESIEEVCIFSIRYAKELIKQLDKESI